MVDRSSPKQSLKESVDESSRSSSSSKLDGAAEDSTLVFSCRCTNVSVTGRLVDASGLPSTSKGTLEALLLDKGCEKSKHPIYIGYDAPEPERRSRRLSHSGDGEASAVPVWRVYWMCGTKLYQAEGKRKGDAAVEEGPVAIDRSGIIISTGAEQISYLPYSNLILPLPQSSDFGRPPQEPPAVYPTPSSPSRRPPTHLPRIPDPFFLPPPFIPAHPHLRDLCANAVDYLTACHSSSEIEVKNFIAVKAQEMRGLEEKVRAEVELMWDKYVQGPGREDVRERERRRSESVGASVDRKGKRERKGFGNGELSGISSSPSPLPDNPILREAALATFPTGASLLSASISQSSYMPRPAPVSDQVDNTIDELARTYDTKGDQRAVAMSYVFSNLNGVMGKSVQDETEVKVQDLHGRDSWVDEERSEAWRRERKAVKAASNDEERPKASALVKERRDSTAEGKGRKAKVSFEVPVLEDDQPADDDGEFPFDFADIDYVFDFELEDRPSASPLPVAETANPEITRSRNLLEQTLSSTYASHAPSHRSAHQRLLDGGRDTYSPFRRRMPTSGGEDGSTVSKLATSVPMPIAFRGSTPKAAPYPFERKTSLSDRQGMLVPPLMKAMRQRGLEDGNSLGLSSPKPVEKGDTKPSSSKVPFNADPGPVLGSMGDGDEEAEDQEGTLRDTKFVPPHVLARKESLKSGDVGWRSMVRD